MELRASLEAGKNIIERGVWQREDGNEEEERERNIEGVREVLAPRLRLKKKKGGEKRENLQLTLREHRPPLGKLPHIKKKGVRGPKEGGLLAGTNKSRLKKRGRGDQQPNLGVAWGKDLCLFQIENHRPRKERKA